jgi:dolichol-phosphate mannosyltransferase
MAAQQPLVSVVIPVLNEAECVAAVHAELRRVCDPLPYRFEFLFVDDGSSDGTAGSLAGLRRGDERVHFLVLSRNFGHQAALSAGLAHAAGDAVITMDGDLQHPPALIVELLARFADGYDVVNTTRLSTAEVGLGKRLFSRLFYRVFNWLACVHIEPGGADYRLLARPVVDALNRLPEVRRFLRGLVPWLGFRQTVVPFTAPARVAGRSKYTFWRSLRLAVEGITAFSFYPLRKLALFGGGVALAAFVYALLMIGFHLFGGATVPGWTSLLFCVLFLGGCQLFALGVIGEYVGRVLEQVKERPVYLVSRAVGVAADEADAVPVRRAG